MKNEIVKVTVRVPHELHHKAKVKLVDNEISFQDFVVEKLKELVN
jgi:predicted HicB family RNase H-like nuclease